MSRADQYAVHVTIDGGPALADPFDTLTGGEVDSEETKYRPGAMGETVSLGGPKVIGNLTASRAFIYERDVPILHDLMAACGRAKVTVSKQPLDVDGHYFGRALVYTGTLKRCTPPPYDASSGTLSTMEIEITCDGPVG